MKTYKQHINERTNIKVRLFGIFKKFVQDHTKMSRDEIQHLLFIMNNKDIPYYKLNKVRFSDFKYDNTTSVSNTVLNKLYNNARKHLTV